MQGEGVSHNLRFRRTKLLKSPDFFRCIRMNFPKIQKDALNWCIGHAYYSRARNLEQPKMRKIKDIILSLYWCPNIIMNKFAKIIKKHNHE